MAARQLAGANTKVVMGLLLLGLDCRQNHFLQPGAHLLGGRRGNRARAAITLNGAHKAHRIFLLSESRER